MKAAGTSPWILADGLAALRARPWRTLVVAAALALACVLLAGAWRGQAARAALLTADPDHLDPGSSLASDAAARGAGIFRARCARCHGRNARGDPATGTPDLADADWLYGTGETSVIESVIDHGIRSRAPGAWALADMPAYARPQPSRTEVIAPLSPQDLRDVVEFVVSLGGRPAEAAASARGREIFETRGACFDCHGTDGRGDPATGAPRLTDAVWLYGDGGRAAIAASIARGRHGVSPAFAGRLSAAQIREVALYVHGLSVPARRR